MENLLTDTGDSVSILIIKKSLPRYSRDSLSKWCGRQDLNLHAEAIDPKSIVSANFTTPAFTAQLL